MSDLTNTLRQFADKHGLSFDAHMELLDIIADIYKEQNEKLQLTLPSGGVRQTHRD